MVKGEDVLKFYKLMILFAGMILLSSPVFAEDVQPKPLTVKSVLIDPAFVGSYESYQLDKKGLREAIVHRIMRVKKLTVSFLTYNELEDKIGAFTKHDMKALRKDNPDFYQELMNRYMPKYVDGVLKIDMVYLTSGDIKRQAPGEIPLSDPRGELSYDVDKEKIPLETTGGSGAKPNKGGDANMLYRTEIRYDNTYDKAKKQYVVKQKIVPVPYEKYQAIFASKEITKAVGVKLSIRSLDSQQELWQYSESRSIEKTKQLPLEVVNDLFIRGMGQWKRTFGEGVKEAGLDPGESFTSDDIHYFPPQPPAKPTAKKK